LALKINYTPEAQADLDQIFEFISRENPEAARRTIARILQGVAVLESFPLLGRVGRLPRTREWFIAQLPYFVAYRLVDDREIDIVAVIHTSRIWPPSPTEDTV
jgi:toxin ParE1/3/4